MHQERVSDLIMDGCEPLCGCWDLNSGPSEEQSVLLTTESSLQPRKTHPMCGQDHPGREAQDCFKWRRTADHPFWDLLLFPDCEWDVSRCSMFDLPSLELCELTQALSPLSCLCLNILSQQTKRNHDILNNTALDLS